MGTAKVKYSLETRKLRVYHFDSPEPNFWDRVGIVRFQEKVFFLERLREDLEKRAQDFVSGKLIPDSPYAVQEISFLLRWLKRVYPVLVLNLPGWRNPRENPRAEWLATLKELDQNLAQKVRQFIQDEGKHEYLRQNARD